MNDYLLSEKSKKSNEEVKRGAQELGSFAPQTLRRLKKETLAEDRTHKRRNSLRRSRTDRGGWRDSDSPKVVLLTTHGETRSQIQKLATLVGVEIIDVPRGSPVGYAPIILEEIPGSYVSLTLSPYLQGPGIPIFPTQIHVVADREQLLEVLVVAAYPFKAKIIGVTGVLGGVGASLFSATLAHLCPGRVGIVDMSQIGAGLEILCAIEDIDGMRWVDVPNQALIPARFAEALPEWNKVKVLSADARGFMPSVHTAMGAVRALGQYCDVVVLDLPVSLLSTWSKDHRGGIGDGFDGGMPWKWCDQVVVISKPGVRGAAATLSFMKRLEAAGMEDPTLLVRTNSNSEALSMADMVGAKTAWAYKQVKNLDSSIEHGISPAEFRGGITKLARAIINSWNETGIFD